MPEINRECVNHASVILKDASQPLKKRFRALFTLRNLGGIESIDAINEVIRQDSSVLLKHECCYCLGQMADPIAIHHLKQVLADGQENEVVRHEAGEALGNLADQNVDLIQLLQDNLDDPSPIVAQTCELALDLIRWRSTTSVEDRKAILKLNPYSSVDPAPSFTLDTPIDKLQSILLDPNSKLFDKYRALFTLRNIGDDQSVRLLGETLIFYKGHQDQMSLFKHEIGYIFGQMQSPVSVPYLKEALECEREHEIVRHEAAEALGSVATLESLEILKPFLKDKATIVRNSVEVALDMIDYENDVGQFNFLS